MTTPTAPDQVVRLLATDGYDVHRLIYEAFVTAGARDFLYAPFAGPDERCTVWLLDPRFPLPKSMTRVIGGPDQGLAAKHLDLIHCIPARFRNGPRPAVDRGRIWPLARDT